MLAFTRDLYFYLKENRVLHQWNAPGSAYSSLKTGGNILCLAAPEGTDALTGLVRFAVSRGIPYAILGRGTDSFVAAAGYPGVLISTAHCNFRSLEEKTLFAECGCVFSALQPMVKGAGFSLPPELLGIPGSVGGMIRMNAGAFGRSVSGILLSARIYDPAQDAAFTVLPGEMGFSYRMCDLAARGAILLSARFSLLEDRPELAEILSACREERRAKQPLAYPSVGSWFLRHEGIGAGYYIERAGFRGMRIGGAAVSVRHAGFFVNLGGARPEDFFALETIVASGVKNKFGFELTPERNIFL